MDTSNERYGFVLWSKEIDRTKDGQLYKEKSLAEFRAERYVFKPVRACKFKYRLSHGSTSVYSF